MNLKLYLRSVNKRRAMKYTSQNKNKQLTLDLFRSSFDDLAHPAPARTTR